MKYASISLVAMVLASSSACAADGTAQSFIGTPWRIQTVGNQESFADGLATLSFGRDGQLSAFGGCNGMGGKFAFENGTLTIGPMMATRMACAEAQKMTDEQTLADALGKGPFKVEETPAGATLKSKGGTVIVLVPVDDGEGDPKTREDEVLTPPADVVVPVDNGVPGASEGSPGQ